MKVYHQLSIKERLMISRLLKHCKVAKIARLLGRSRATIKRELERNGARTAEGSWIYDAGQAQASCDQRKRSKARKGYRKYQGREPLLSGAWLQVTHRDYRPEIGRFRFSLMSLTYRRRRYHYDNPLLMAYDKVLNYRKRTPYDKVSITLYKEVCDRRKQRERERFGGLIWLQLPVQRLWKAKDVFQRWYAKWKRIRHDKFESFEWTPDLFKLPPAEPFMWFVNKEKEEDKETKELKQKFVKSYHVKPGGDLYNTQPTSEQSFDGTAIPVYLLGKLKNQKEPPDRPGEVRLSA